MKVTFARPTTPPLVSWQEMKDQVRIASYDEQQLFSDYVEMATDYAETVLDMSLLNRVVTVTHYIHQSETVSPGEWKKHELLLPHGPIQSITSVADANGSITSYHRETEGFNEYLVIDQSWKGPVTIVFVAGQGTTAAAVDASIRGGIRLHTASLWSNRESISDKAMMPVPHTLEDFYRRKSRNVSVA